MKPKSITKKATITKGKRPKSVLRKAWATRRANAKHRASPQGGIAREMYGDNADTSKLKGLAGLVKDMPTSETATHRSETMAPKPKIEMQTDQLLIAAKSNNRSDARPRVRSELLSMIESAKFDGYEQGIKERMAITNDAALCGIVAMYRLWNQSSVKQTHAPFMISDIAAKAVVEHLESLGYSPSGKTNAAAAAGWRYTRR